MVDPGFLRKVRRREAAARVVIVGGGIFIILCVLGILVQIAGVALPLFRRPTCELVARHRLPPAEGPVGARILGAGLDDYLETAYVFREDGTFTFVTVPEGREIERVRLASPGDAAAGIGSVSFQPPDGYAILWSDGSLTLDVVTMSPVFDEDGRRRIRHEVVRKIASPPEGAGDPSVAALRTAARLREEGGTSRVDLLPGNRLRVAHRIVEENFLGDTQESVHAFEIADDIPGEITSFVLDGSASTLYAATRDGYLLRWDLREPDEAVLLDRVAAFEDLRPLESIALVFGDYTLAVGDARGGLTGWFPVTSEATGGRKVLTRTHRLPGHRAAIRAILPTRRDKSIVALDAAGEATLDHMTSDRRLLRFANDAPLEVVGLNGRADGLAAVDSEGRLAVFRIHNPHPEVSLKTLFGKVWYEGYDAPSYQWQSSAATADYEPKMSLVPLIFGTIKGTLYAMVFALPAAIFGALYTSQFLHRRLRGIVKPAIEIMAAIPSVVIGFLAALWFAPLLERNFSGIMLSLAFLPLVCLGTLLGWEATGIAARLRRLRFGYEFLLLAAPIVAGVWLSFLLGGAIEDLLFGGDLQGFLFSEWGVRYDPRNCIVIAFALGFAVIPIIFSISEDALSNVPRSLAAGSLALGASRWQTAWRVILPGAAPGIFAASMIGLGRAVGETMIVLMATGNTAIMDMSPFNGMRTISANIATEAPEAPYLGSLYRILFLSAVLLFVSTFALNTVAELVRQRIRKKYARF